MQSLCSFCSSYFRALKSGLWSRTQISGSSSGHSTPFGCGSRTILSIKNDKTCIICTVDVLCKICVLNGTQISGSTIQKFMGPTSANQNCLPPAPQPWLRSMVYCFIWLKPTSRSIIKAIACSKPTISEHWSKWKHDGTIVDKCKQRWALCHIGLAKDRGGHLVNQPRGERTHSPNTLKPGSHVKRRGTCDSSVWVFTREGAAKARITGRDDKTILSRAFEILAKQRNRLLLHVSSEILLNTMTNTFTPQ